MRPVHDFGIVGPNKGKGDRILIVPPDYKGDLPAGYEVARAKTYQIFSITRIAVTKEMTAEQATAILRKIQTYPLSQGNNPPAKVFVLMGDPAHGGKEFPIIRPSGIDYWRMVHDII